MNQIRIGSGQIPIGIPSTGGKAAKAYSDRHKGTYRQGQYRLDQQALNEIRELRDTQPEEYLSEQGHDRKRLIFLSVIALGATVLVLILPGFTALAMMMIIPVIAIVVLVTPFRRMFRKPEKDHLRQVLDRENEFRPCTAQQTIQARRSSDG